MAMETWSSSKGHENSFMNMGIVAGCDYVSILDHGSVFLFSPCFVAVVSIILKFVCPECLQSAGNVVFSTSGEWGVLSPWNMHHIQVNIQGKLEGI